MTAATASPPWKASYFWMRDQRDHWLNVAKELIEDYERLREENEQLRERLLAIEAQADRFADRLGRDARRRIFDAR